MHNQVSILPFIEPSLLKKELERPAKPVFAGPDEEVGKRERRRGGRYNSTKKQVVYAT